MALNFDAKASGTPQFVQSTPGTLVNNTFNKVSVLYRLKVKDWQISESYNTFVSTDSDIGIYQKLTNKLIFRFKDLAETWHDLPFNPMNGLWYNYVVTYDADENINNLYVNGVLASSGLATSNLNMNYEIKVGVSGNADHAYYEIATWSGILPNDDIAALENYHAADIEASGCQLLSNYVFHTETSGLVDLGGIEDLNGETVGEPYFTNDYPKDLFFPQISTIAPNGGHFDYGKEIATNNLEFNFSIENTGNRPLTIYSLTVSGIYDSVSGELGTLPTGTSREFSINPWNKEIGPQSVHVSIESNAAEPTYEFDLNWELTDRRGLTRLDPALSLSFRDPQGFTRIGQSSKYSNVSPQQSKVVRLVNPSVHITNQIDIFGNVINVSDSSGVYSNIQQR